MRQFERNIVVKIPDEEVLRKMSAIAKALGGRVQGTLWRRHAIAGESRARVM